MDTRMLALLAGAAMSAGVATAQSANDALERELLADTDLRVSLQSGGTSGHDGSSFFVGDAAGNNRLEIGGYTQFRYTFNNRDTTDPDEDFTNGFDMVRTALEFGGNVGNPNLGYYVRGYFNTDDSGSFELRDAYGTYSLDNGVTMIWGQYLVPVVKERFTDERHQLAADRSVTSTYFSPEYTQGVAFMWNNENLKFVGSLNDGAATQNTAYYSATEGDFAVTGRVEFKWAGDWQQFDDFTSWRGTEGYAGVLGGSVHWQSHGDTDADPGTVTTGPIAGVALDSLLLYSVDAHVEGNGWNLYGAFIGRNADPQTADSTDDFGAVIQGGFFFNDNFEAFARWDALFLDEDSLDATSDDNFNTLTFGGNYYFFPQSHAAKFTADLQWHLDEQPTSGGTSVLSVPNQYTSVLSGTDDSQWALRLQMQLVF